MAAKHLFIELRNDGRIEFGINSIYEQKKEVLLSAKPEIFQKIILQIIRESIDTDDIQKDLIFHVHGFLGERQGFHTKTTKVYDEFLLDNDESHSGTIISVIWHSLIGNYKKNWHYAKEVGQTFAPIIQMVNSEYRNNGYKSHIFCHSTGFKI
jgi:hypothetical protein